MKHLKYLLPLLLLTIGISSCGSVSSMSGSKPDEAYLLLVSEQIYDKEVEVTLDSERPFLVTIQKDRRDRSKLKPLIITPGRHHLVVLTPWGDTLYEGQVFVSAGNTKVIEL